MTKFLSFIALFVLFVVCMFLPWYVGHLMGVNVQHAPEWWEIPTVLFLGFWWVIGCIFSITALREWLDT